MDSVARDEFFKGLSNAEKCCKYLNKEDRRANNTRHKVSDGSHVLTERKYFVSNYENDKKNEGAHGHVPMDNCKWKIHDHCWNTQDKDEWALTEDERKQNERASKRNPPGKKVQWTT